MIGVWCIPYTLPNLHEMARGQLGKFKIKGTIWIPSCPFEKMDFFWFMAILEKNSSLYDYVYLSNSVIENLFRKEYERIYHSSQKLWSHHQHKTLSFVECFVTALPEPAETKNQNCVPVLQAPWVQSFSEYLVIYRVISNRKTWKLPIFFSKLP